MINDSVFSLYLIGHMLQTLDIPPYRPFSLKELEDVTNNFDTSSFIKEGPYGQVCIFNCHPV